MTSSTNIQIPISHSLSTHQLPHILQHILSHSLYQTTQVPYLYHQVHEVELSSLHDNPSAQFPSPRNSHSKAFYISPRPPTLETLRNLQPDDLIKPPRQRRLHRYLTQYHDSLSQWCLDILYALRNHRSGDDVTLALVEGSIGRPAYVQWIVFRNVLNSCTEECDSQDDSEEGSSHPHATAQSNQPLTEKQLSNIVRKIVRSLIMNDPIQQTGAPHPTPGRNYCFLWHRMDEKASPTRNMTKSTSAHEPTIQTTSDPLKVWNQNVVSLDAPAPGDTGGIGASSVHVAGESSDILSSFHMKTSMKFKKRSEAQTFVLLEVGERQHLDEEGTKNWLDEWIDNRVKQRRPPRGAPQSRADSEEIRSSLQQGSDQSLSDMRNHVWVQHRQTISGFHE